MDYLLIKTVMFSSLAYIVIICVLGLIETFYKDSNFNKDNQI